ncbi:MAG: thioredoxin-dependent thiol peroxidase [Flavobacteriales bacterium]|nr:thioredoxin-dependent thiol peroxidase [Flavobacteriales bacterium]
MSKLEIGTKIPNFTTIDQNEETISDNDFIGRKTILYFYPQDDTPTCTNQACNLRDHFEELKKAGYTLFGISPDKAKKHQKFISKYQLPFDLLVDEDHKIAEKFGVWALKKTFGKEYMGIVRTTFIINEEGKISNIIDDVVAKKHSEQILG